MNTMRIYGDDRDEDVVEGYKVYDAHGQLIEVDRWITYPVRQGSNMRLAHAKVTSIKTVRRRGWRNEEHLSTLVYVTKLSGKKTSIDCISRIVQAPLGWTPPG